MKTDYSDQEILGLIRGTMESRKLALELLYCNRSLKNAAFAMINQMLKDQTQAEDIFVDALIIFIEQIKKGKFKEKSSINTFIVSICKFKCLKHVEKQKNQRKHGKI